MPTPQIILFLDSAGALHAEAPSLNGNRQKIDLDGWTVDDLPPAVADALFLQLTRSRAAEQAAKAHADAEALARRKRFFSLSYEHRVLGEEKLAADERARSGKPAKHSAVLISDADIAKL